MNSTVQVSITPMTSPSSHGPKLLLPVTPHSGRNLPTANIDNGIRPSSSMVASWAKINPSTSAVTTMPVAVPRTSSRSRQLASYGSGRSGRLRRNAGVPGAAAGAD